MINSLCWYSSVNSSGVKKLKYVQGNLEQIGQKETPLFSTKFDIASYRNGRNSFTAST